MWASHRGVLTLLTLLFSLVPHSGTAQERETLLGGEREIRAAWGLESRIKGIQDDVSATWGLYGGVTVNEATMLALTLAANLTHPEVNFGYFGPIVSYTLRPDELVHGGASLLFAFANTKDYEREKSSLFDNFGNTSGEGFYFIEPALVGSLNLTDRFRLRVGVGWRLAWGLDETTQYTTRTGVTAGDISGPSFTVGIGS